MYSSDNLMAQLCAHVFPAGPGYRFSAGRARLPACNLLLLIRKTNMNYELMGKGLSTSGRTASKLLTCLQKLVASELLNKALSSPLQFPLSETFFKSVQSCNDI